MSVATELQRITDAKADLKTAIEAKGVTVSSSALIDAYADYVDSIPTGDPPAPVGGIIFYIDSRSDEIVEFYDASGNVLSNVAVGDSPASYKVLDYGASGFAKYYVYYNEVFFPGSSVGKLWTYNNGTSYVKTLVGVARTDIGSGKTNTSTVMSADSGAYVSYGSSVWHYLNQYRSNQLGGCKDWFIGSKDELEQLRLFQVANAGTGEVTDFFTNLNMHSSSEKSATFDHIWYNTSWTYDDKSSGRPFCILRSF